MSDSLARSSDATMTLSSDQHQLVADTIAKGASKDELRMFIATCNRLRLDPFARQIFLVKRYDSSLGREVAQSQVSIDGFRLVAERTGQYRGQSAPEWCGMDGVWKDVWLSRDPPAAARVGVFREGFTQPLVRVARYASYVQTKRDGAPNRMWSTMPDVMLSKCAESLALRAAFPNELSGIYTSEEMGQVQHSEEYEPPKKRSLDDVAATAPAKQATTDAAIDPEVTVQVVVESAELHPPKHEIPVFQTGPHSGRLYTDVPAGKLRALLANEKWTSKASDAQREWAQYVVRVHELSKAQTEDQSEQETSK